MPYIVGSTFLAIFEWFALNSNPKSLFEKLSISDFLVDFLMYIGI